jgi:hypothetical protein
MSQVIKALLLIGLSTLFSCKRCYTCQNECYKCGSSQVVYCSTDFNSRIGWLEYRDNYLNSLNCTKIDPSQSLKVCDTKNKDLIYIYEKNNFYCTY